MLIESMMDLDELAERIGRDATRDDAEAVRDALFARGYAGRDTADIPERIWIGIVASATN